MNFAKKPVLLYITVFKRQQFMPCQRFVAKILRTDKRSVFEIILFVEVAPPVPTGESQTSHN